MAPHPPGPGLPLHAPSVKISTSDIDPISAGTGHPTVKPQLPYKLSRILRLHQRACSLVEPVVEPRQQEPERAAAGKERQGVDLGSVKLPHFAVLADEKTRLRDIEAQIWLETPGIKADCNVVGEEIGAGEIEVDQTRELAVAKKHVVRKEIGMDDAARQVARPCRFEKQQLLLKLGGKSRLHVVSVRGTRFVKPPPAREPQIVGSRHRKRPAGEVQLRERRTYPGTVVRLDPAPPHPL